VEGPYTPGPRRLSLRIHGVPVSAARLGERALSIHASAAGEPPHTRIDLPYDSGAWTVALLHEQ